MIRAIRSIHFLSACLALCWSVTVQAQTPSAADTRLYFISPADGETVHSPLTVRFGLQGMGVAPAGVERDKTGHHHLLIDVDQLPALHAPVPSDANHRHFGGGQTEIMLELKPGEHSLQLLLGDHMHIPHNPPVLSQRIRFKVD